MKLSHVSRVVRLLTLLQSEKAMPPEELARITGISRRTLFRDLRELSAIGVPYHYDPRTGGYKVEPHYFMPAVDLTLQEALSLLLLVHKGRNHLPVPFKNAVILAGIKVENNLPAPIRKYCDSALRNISVRPSPYSPTDSLDRFFSILQQAVTRKTQVQLKYDSLADGGLIELTLCPYHLFYNNRAWYVVGLSSLHKEVRMFKLNRIQNIDVLDKGFVDAGQFDLCDYLGNAWSMIPEGRLYSVKLRFSPKVARNVAEVQWHRSQKTSFEPDGSLRAEFVVDGLNEIYWWILGYGDQVEVLAPAALRKKIFQTAQNMQKNHQE
jgi:proteasome accessory factor B